MAFVFRAAKRLRNRFIMMAVINVIIPCVCLICHMFSRLYYYLFFNSIQVTNTDIVGAGMIVFISQNEIEVH